MEDEHKGVALVILGIIAIIAVIGLVLMFSGAKKSAGAVPTLLGEAPSGFCDSPCTFAFGASQSEVAMQTQRFRARGFVPVGQVEFTYIADNFPLYGQCLCPGEGIPQFANTPEDEQIVYGTPLSGRTPGTPSPMYVETPAPTIGQYPLDEQSPPSYPYPASLNK
ncbi:hypothetical protein HY489_02360 [Candidatus Woesearchaeota archaeon]|nr:hypothetical protein [Candidatus Woesearchaeota archaeon]